MNRISSLVFASLLATAACKSEKPTPAPADTAAVPAPAPTDAAPALPDAAALPADATAEAPKDCVPSDVADVIGGLDPELARLEGSGVELCGLMGEARKCVVVDLTTGLRSVLAVEELDVKRLPDYPAGFDDGIIRDDARPVIKVCLSAETGCKDLHAGQIMTAHFDATRTQVVLASWDDGKRKAKVYDTASLELKHSFDISEGDLPDCTFAGFAGKQIVVSTGSCSGGGTSWLIDPATGNKVADIGGDKPIFIRDGHYAAVPAAGENAFAFRAADGDSVVMQDVVTGAVLGRLDLKEAVGDTTPKHEGAWMLVHEAGLVLVESRPVPDSVYVVDPKAMTVKQSLIPKPCP